MLAVAVLVLLAAAAVSCKNLSLGYKIGDMKTGVMEEVDASKVHAGDSSAPPAPETMDPKDANVIRDMKTGVMEEVNASKVHAGDSSAPPAPETMDPEDANVIRAAIQKLLNGDERIDDVDYVASTNPTRSPRPGTPPRSNLQAPSRSMPFTQKPQDPSDSPIQSYHRLVGQLVDYAQKMERTKIPTRTQIVRMPTSDAVTPAGVPYSPTSLHPLDELRAALRTHRRPTLPTKPTTTTTRYRSTKNTLCTDSDEFCKTMCFDEDKYRVSCTTRATSPRVDFSRLLGILDVLIAEYDTNLTDVFNKTLKEKGYASCPPTGPPPPTTTTVTTPEPTPGLYDYEASNQTGAIIGKCYVCGLVAPGIPEDAHCSDAFSGEFLPLTPVDASARGKLASFRKYCKYMDMLPWYVNGSDGRSIWGKWTGGCSVRWIDLSGLYTQRACRSRHHPMTGAHFASKRMAKLEKALMRVDNGCIASPMASLVPFSRGVSLYARFHACVCTGNWCNSSTRVQHHTILTAQALVLLGSL